MIRVPENLLVAEKEGEKEKGKAQPQGSKLPPHAGI